MPRTANIPCADCERMFTSETTLAMHRANKHKPGQASTPPATKSRPPAATTPAAADDDDDDVMDAF